MLLTSFKIYPILPEGVFVVPTAVRDTNQKLKIEAQVQTRQRKSFIFKKSSLLACRRG